ncbi:MAG: metallophosphoesterase [Actinobacteria bacterium]|nr:metallophosphoesterase [Actinomycetota bacterium]
MEVGPRRLTRLTIGIMVAVLASFCAAVAPTLADGAPDSAASGSPTPRAAITLDRPAGTAAGNVMLASVVVNDSTEGFVAPEGWSLVRDDSIPGTIRQAVYVKVAGASEPGDYTWSLSTPRFLAGGITAYPGLDPTNLIDAQAAAAQPAGDGTVAAPIITTSVPNALLVQLTAVSAEGTITPGEGLTGRWDAASADPDSVNDALASAADTVQPLPGPVNPLSVTASRPGPAVTAVIAFRPEAGGPTSDLDAPDTTIESGPPAIVGATTATFVFSAGEPASFTCRLDDGDPAACSSPVTFTGLAAGAHTVAVAATDVAGNRDPDPATRQWTVEATAGPDPVLVGAGDIADCTSPGDEATADLVEGIPGTVFTIGDNAYTNATATEFANCYDPTWGRFKDRTMPAAGNHEYQPDPTAAAYYQYFGAVAGDPAKGYYDYTVGSWHVIVLNTTCANVGGCGAGSPQEQWLRGVLAASNARCTVAVTHHSRFSSGKEHGSMPAIQPLWQALYDYGADLVLSGHDHVYERFGMQSPGGVADAVFGLREIMVGTGGRDHRTFGTAVANSELRNNTSFGVLELSLHDDSYDWQFVPEAGKSFTDQGTTACHDAPRLSVPDPFAITRVGSSSSGSSALRSKVTLTRPSGTKAGDVMVASVVGSNTTKAFTAPTGWTLVNETPLVGSLRQAVYLKVAGASEPRSYTCNLGATQVAAGGVTTYSGVDVADPVASDAVSVNTTAATAVPAPALTTTVPGAALVQFAAVNADGRLSPPAGMKEQWEARSVDTKGKRDIVASSSDALEPAGGPKGAWAGTTTKRGRSVVVSVALRPQR